MFYLMQYFIRTQPELTLNESNDFFEENENIRLACIIEAFCSDDFEFKDSE